MSLCPITGDAQVQETCRDGVHREWRWVRADNEIHVVLDVLEGMDQAGREFFEARYEVGEPCMYQRGTWHARKRGEGLG